MSTLWPGESFSLEYEKELVHKKSEYQDLVIFQSKSYGKVLVLDGAIQVTERDQFSYAEMISHVPLFAHPNPKSVLMIGGGDGAAICEVLKHKDLEFIDWCEIDQLVKDECKEHFPQYRLAFEHPKINHVVQDGFVYLKTKENTYDVIIVDSSDPIGPAESLFQQEFYHLLKKSLKPGGLVCSQAESIWLHLEIIQNLKKAVEPLFTYWSYSQILVPTYPSGAMGLMVAGESSPLKPHRTPAQAFEEKDVLSVKYYSPQVHESSFVLPLFAQNAIYGHNPEEKEKSK